VRFADIQWKGKLQINVPYATHPKINLLHLNSPKKVKKMAQIPDALEAAPNVYKLLMENDRVRVLDVRVKPGEKTKIHSHPDRVVYVLSDHRLKFTSADGASRELELRAGQVLWIEAGVHTTENTGMTEAHNLAVELKE
jgi:quercetin dioxygenase-like cupin family protein